MNTSNISKYVYFKLSKKALAASSIYNLTPNKLYKLTVDYKLPSDMSPLSPDTIYIIIADNGRSITCPLTFKSSHLDELTMWIKATTLTVVKTKKGKTKLTIQELD